MDDPKSIKEFWAEPEHNRRRSAGRRDSDYAVCNYHDSQVGRCQAEMEKVWDRFKILEERIVGKWTVGVIVTILLSVITISTGASVLMFQSIKADMKTFHNTLK